MPAVHNLRVMLIYHVHSFVPCTKQSNKFPRGSILGILCNPKCHFIISKGQPLLWSSHNLPEHSGLCCFGWWGQWWWMWCWDWGDALSAQGSTGGYRPGAGGICTHQYKAGWVNMASRTAGKGKKKQRIEDTNATTLLWRNANTTHSGIFSARCSICSIRDWKEKKRHQYKCTFYYRKWCAA